MGKYDDIIWGALGRNLKNARLTATTQLPPDQEAGFQQWSQFHNVPLTDDYDMRGFYQGLVRGDPHAQTGINPNDGQLHFSDYWKTPLHRSFSVESMYAKPSAPHWEGNQLIDENGNVVFDETVR